MNNAATTFTERVAAELARARIVYSRHQTLEHSFHVLAREVQELRAEVDRKTVNRSALIAEAVQVAAMAQRLVEDNELLTQADQRGA